MDMHNHIFNVFKGFQKSACVDNNLALPGGKLAGIGGLIGRKNHSGDLIRIQSIGCKPDGIDPDFDSPADPADQGGEGDVGFPFHPVLHLGGHAAKGEMVGAFAPKREGQDRDVVNIAGFDQGRANTAGYPVRIGHEF